MSNIINHKEGYILSLKLLWTANTWAKKEAAEAVEVIHES